MLDNLVDPVGCVAQANADLKRLLCFSPDSPPRELVRGLKLIAGYPSVAALKKAKYNEDGSASDIWRKAGIQESARDTDSGKQTRIPLPTLQHHFMHACHQEVEAFVSGGSEPAVPKHRLYADFYAACRSPDRRQLEPFPTSLDSQCGRGRFKPYQCLEQLALIELVDAHAEKIYRHEDLLDRIRTQRQREVSECRVLSEVLDSATQRLVNYSLDSACVSVNARFLNLQGTKAERQEKLSSMVQTLADAFEKERVDATAFKPNHFATLSVYYALFLKKDNSKSVNGLARWCFGLRKYVPGCEIEAESDKRAHLASQCLPRHFDDTGAVQPAGLERSGQAIASAPVTCELCHVWLAGHDKLVQHCREKHGGVNEYRKRLFYRGREAPPQPLHPWVKRNSVQGFTFFKINSVASSCNDYTMKATKEAVPRREEACAICARRNWLEKRHQVFLFEEGTRTTTWKQHTYPSGDEDPCYEDDEEGANTSGNKPSAQGTLLVEDDGIFCLGPKEKINAILDVQRYVTQWPLVPADELHASSVQHPDDVNMRWLLHSRRVACTPSESSSASLPRSAGIGVKSTAVWCCRPCVEHLCTEKPRMPPLALANAFFLGRHHFECSIGKGPGQKSRNPGFSLPRPSCLT